MRTQSQTTELSKAWENPGERVVIGFSFAISLDWLVLVDLQNEVN